MAKFEVNVQGAKYEVEAPDENTAWNWANQTHIAAQPKQEMSWQEVASKGIANLPSSVANVVGGVAEAVMHPLETAKSAAQIVGGGVIKALPESAQQALMRNAYNPQAMQESLGKAEAAGEFYKNRYGSVKGFKEALATDPAGVAADISTVFTGGGAAATKVPGLARAGEALSTAGRTVDPLVASLRAGKSVVLGAGQAAGKVLGMTTGAGEEAIKQAFRAGSTGGKTAKDFTANLRGEANMMDVLETARADLDAMGKEKQAAYRSGIENIKNDKSVLDFGGIEQSISNAQARTKYGTKITDATAAKAVDDVRSLIDDWKNSDPAQYHTPEGMDALKRAINDQVLSKLDFVKDKNARAAVGEIYSTVKNTIQSQAPTYAKVMRDYSEASDTIKEIERALSLGEKSSADTAMRKLQSLMRNNVQTNYGQRISLAKELEQAGGREIMPALAGQALQEWTPRGLQRATAIPTGVGAFSVGGAPAAAASLAASSPRLAGEATYGAGQLARGLRGAGKFTNMPFVQTGVDPRILANMLYQANQQRNQK